MLVFQRVNEGQHFCKRYLFVETIIKKSLLFQFCEGFFVLLFLGSGLNFPNISNSKLRLLKILPLNLIVRWLVGAAI